MRTQDLISDTEFRDQRALLVSQASALRNVKSDDSLDAERARRELAAITAPLASLRATWRELQPSYRLRFVRSLMPVGFLAGSVRTAELTSVFKVFQGLGSAKSREVALAGLHTNQLYEEIAGFTRLLRDAGISPEEEKGAVRKQSTNVPLREPYEPPMAA